MGSTARLVLALASAVIALAFAQTGPARALEDAARLAFFATQARDASGQLHIVEMDAASVAAAGRWPWPREHYAAVVDRLVAAGAKTITFDVDFSSPSTQAGDQAMAAALSRSKGKVALPTFAQVAGHDDARRIEALPRPEFRDLAALASVAVLPDADGLVRRMPMGAVTGGAPRPTLAALIAGGAGTADVDFPIELAIRPRSIPRHSFADIERGIVPAGALAGRDVLIGATAIEMGDRYAVAGHGVLPGVVVTALATETLYAGKPADGGLLLGLALAFGAALMIAAAARRRTAIAGVIAAVAAILVVYWLAWDMGRLLLAIMPALLTVGLTGSFVLARLLHEDLRARRMRDAATGLPNRVALETGGAPGGAYIVAAKLGGIERLQAVLGSAGSADLVRRIADRLIAGNGGAPVYRIDDRILAWRTTGRDYELEAVLSGLWQVMRQPIEIGGRQIDVHLAFGIAQPDALSEAAHAASEALTRNERFLYHVAAEREALERQVTLMGELDYAIVRDEIDVLYQPKLELAHDRITSVEALVRWHHPTRGYMRPDLFIPLAEETDRIADLTLYVLSRTIEDLREWCRRDLILRAAVNISARLVANEEFIAAAEALLNRSGVPRDRLIFEVTESATIADPAAAAAALQRFCDMGIAISMDDYGTGQSSLTYIKQLPLSELKIDRSFVQDAHRDRGDALLVRSTVDLAHELGLAVVAEGVETAECLDFLRRVGCDYAQGYLIGRPMTSADLQLLVAQPAPVVAVAA